MPHSASLCSSRRSKTRSDARASILSRVLGAARELLNLWSTRITERLEHQLPELDSRVSRPTALAEFAQGNRGSIPSTKQISKGLFFFGRWFSLSRDRLPVREKQRDPCVTHGDGKQR
jgi:hypothetical protein